MLGRIPGFLPRLPLRSAPLPLARLTAARVPGSLDRLAARARLHVFARLPDDDHTKVEVGDGADAGDFKKAVLAELRLAPWPRAPACILYLVSCGGLVRW